MAEAKTKKAAPKATTKPKAPPSPKATAKPKPTTAPKATAKTGAAAKRKTKAAAAKAPASRYHYALGRRKTATARVRLLTGSGVIRINGQPAADYLGRSQPLLAELQQPFAVVGAPDKFDVSAKVVGGGHHGQVGAIKLGIARSLVIADPDYKDTLKRHDLLGRDPRAKERKKFGLRGARKQRQFTKR